MDGARVDAATVSPISYEQMSGRLKGVVVPRLECPRVDGFLFQMPALRDAAGKRSDHVRDSAGRAATPVFAEQYARVC
jgi:hypothetical protein